VTGRIIDLAGKRVEYAVERPKSRLSFRIEPTGALLIQELNSRGASTREWELSEDNGRRVVAELQRRYQRRASDAYFEKHPDRRPKPPKVRDPAKRLCRLTINGMIGAAGCRRRTGHEGPHKRGGETWVMAYPHHRFCASTTRIVGGSLEPGVAEVFVSVPEVLRGLLGDTARIYVKDGRCRRCGFRVGPELIGGAR